MLACIAQGRPGGQYIERVWTVGARALGTSAGFVLHVHACAGVQEAVGWGQASTGFDTRPQPGLLFSCDHARLYLAGLAGLLVIFSAELAFLSLT